MSNHRIYNTTTHEVISRQHIFKWFGERWQPKCHILKLMCAPATFFLLLIIPQLHALQALQLKYSTLSNPMPNKTKTAKKPNHGPTKRIYWLLSQHSAHTDTTKFKKAKKTPRAERKKHLKKETARFLVIIYLKKLGFNSYFTSICHCRLHSLDLFNVVTTI